MFYTNLGPEMKESDMNHHTEMHGSIVLIFLKNHDNIFFIKMLFIIVLPLSFCLIYFVM